MSLHQIMRWIRRSQASPPPLVTDYTQADFINFMREETFLYSKKYACSRVVIHGGQHLVNASQQKGALLACLHYGSFFLSGGAIFHQLGLPYTAVVTSRNLAVLNPPEKAFWRGVHQRTATLYERPLFMTGDSPRSMLKWLDSPSHLLGIVLDVREQGVETKEYPFTFMDSPIIMQVGPARLACMALVPMLPMNIQYHPEERCHHLTISQPIMPSNDPIEMTRQALHALDTSVRQVPEQFFHDIITVFADPERLTESH